MTEPVQASEVRDAVSVVRNRRTDSMFVVACMFIAWLVWMVVYKPDMNQFAQSVVNIVLGMFLRELGSMFSFENGGTRSGQTKDATIKSLAEAAPIQSAAAVAATVAATAAATPGAPVALVPVAAATGAPVQPAPTAPIQAENVAIDAKSVTVDQPKGDSPS